MRGSCVYSLIFAVYSSSIFCFVWGRDCAVGRSPGITTASSITANAKRTNGLRSGARFISVLLPDTSGNVGL